MIDYITGSITELTPTSAVLDNHGIGYMINISLTTYDVLNRGTRESATLYIHEAIREDAHLLYGFATKNEREAFLLLITVSGVGPNTARMILSSASPNELCGAIANGDERMLKGVKGIGLKTAQRIIVDLKDKIVSLGIATEIPAAGAHQPTVNQSVRDEAVSALTMLGFSPAPSAKVVTAILQEQPDMPVEQVVKLALKQIK